MIDTMWYLMALRLILALLFGGAIGFERESPNRPAGFRTHILVCVGAALAMLTSEFLFTRYQGLTNLDPARLGAQVISGIGFLGAGTIIKDKFKVRGLTTAASLWSVACIGLAVGAGYYLGAAFATLIIYITLMALKKMEKRLPTKGDERAFYITGFNQRELLTDVMELFAKHEVYVSNIAFNRSKNRKNILLKIVYDCKKTDCNTQDLMMQLYQNEYVSKVTHD